MSSIDLCMYVCIILWAHMFPRQQNVHPFWLVVASYCVACVFYMYLYVCGCAVDELFSHIICFICVYKWGYIRHRRRHRRAHLKYTRLTFLQYDKEELANANLHVRPHLCCNNKVLYIASILHIQVVYICKYIIYVCLYTIRRLYILFAQFLRICPSLPFHQIRKNPRKVISFSLN